MKLYIILVAVFVVAVSARPQNPADRDAVIVRSNINNDVLGSYQYSFETSNGIAQEEQGNAKDLGGTEGPAVVVTGSFRWTAPDGQTYEVKYIADENGFQPQGAHLPTK